jgi:lipid A oxidase
MTGILTAGWTGQRPASRATRTFETLSALAAAVLLTASTAATIMESSALSSASGSASTNPSRDVSTLPTKETMVGAYTGAPYHYPSTVHIGKEGADTDVTIDPVEWYGDPFHNPIYYGARVARWFTGGKAGMMVDFIHSKSMAELDKEASLSGKVNGETMPPRARIRDVVSKMEFSHGHNMLLFTGLMRLPSLGARVSPYVGAGAGVLLPHAEVTLQKQNTPRTYEYNYAGPAGQALAGVEIRLARMSFFVEYKFTYADYNAPLSQMNGSWLFLDLWRQIKRWMDGEEPPGGHVTTQIVSHQVVGGLAVRIAARPAAP